MNAIAKLERVGKNESETKQILATLTANDVIGAYREFFNNYLTYSVFAERHSLTLEYTTLLLDTGRQLEANSEVRLSSDTLRRLVGITGQFWELY